MKALITFVVIVATVTPGLADAAQSAQRLESLIQASDEVMAEEYRRSVQKIVVLPGLSPASGAVTGSYRKETDGLLDGVDRGREIGVFRKDIGGIPISFPIRILTIPGMIFGGLTGTVKRQIQDFRDAMTENLAESAATPLTNDALATDVFWRLREVSGLKPKVFARTTPIPEDTDAILYVSFSDSSIEVDGKIARIKFTATATLRRYSDGQHLYEKQFFYEDSDTLGNWTQDDTAAWRDYANFARHYLGREIVAELFERVAVQQLLRPKETATVRWVKKNAWQGISTTQTPTLAWDLELAGDDKQLGWAKEISAAEVSYDVEVYDQHQLVYVARDVAEPQLTLDIELEACKTYRWTVRPSYKLDGAIRFGEWMRSNPDAANGNVGTAGAEASAYIYDFASLQLKCGRR